MTERRPIDGYRDVYEWPYAWSLDFGPGTRLWLDELPDNGFFFIDAWTYKNHWCSVLPEYPDRHRDVVDLFKGGGPWTRGHMPIEDGNELAAYTVENYRDEVACVMWNERRWTQDLGWRPYGGLQGQFNKQVHIEFLQEALLSRFQPFQVPK